MSSLPRIVIFASGRGSNFEALAHAIDDRSLCASIEALICDHKDAPVMNKAKSRGLPAHCIPGGDEAKILEVLKSYAPDFAVMAGYMRVLKKPLLNRFRSSEGYYKIVNIHPSLLPAFAGLDGYRKAFEHGCKLAGVTVHLVDEGLDQGPICAQVAFSIADCDSAAEVERRGLIVEHALYPKTLQWILKNQFKFRNVAERTHVRPS